MPGDIIMGTKGKCDLAACRIEGETNWRFRGQHNNPYDAEQKALIDSVRNGKPINSGYHMANSTMVGGAGPDRLLHRQAVHLGQVTKSQFQYGPSPDESSFETAPPSVPDETGNYPLRIPGATKML